MFSISLVGYIYTFFQHFRSEAYERRNEKFRESSSSKFNFFDGQHQFQENTYKKITACDVCREILRGIIDYIFLSNKSNFNKYLIVKNRSLASRFEM
jgi:hypothetical protein